MQYLSLTQVHQIFQIAFYVLGSALAILTYMSAKNGLLNTVNTEYYKRVLDNIQSISVELVDEFDIGKRSGGLSSYELFDRIEKDVDKRDDAEGGRTGGVPIVAEIIKFKDLAGKYETDPFLPEPIRDAVAGFFNDRWMQTIQAHQEIAPLYREKYWDYVHEGKVRPSRDGFHNKINARLYELNVGPSQLEARAHDARRLIRDYFAEFDKTSPRTKRWQKRQGKFPKV